MIWTLTAAACAGVIGYWIARAQEYYRGQDAAYRAVKDVLKPDEFFVYPCAVLLGRNEELRGWVDVENPPRKIKEGKRDE